MNASEQASALRTDPNYLVSFIVYNNPNAVADRLQGLGIATGAKPENIFAAINELLANGKVDQMIDVLSVPANTDYLDTTTQFALESAAKETRRANAGSAKGVDAMAPVGSGSGYLNPNAPMYGEPGFNSYSEASNTVPSGASQPGGGNFWSWGGEGTTVDNVYGGLLAGVQTYLQASGSNGISNSQQAALHGANSEAARKARARRTTTIVIIVVVILVVIGSVIMIRKRRK